MLCKKLKLILLYLFLIFRNDYINCLNLIYGNNEGISSFNFAIGAHTINRNNIFYVGAESAISTPYSISMCSQNSLTFRPLCSEKATVNLEPDQINPLYGKKISTLTPFAGNVVATTSDNTNTDKKVFIVIHPNDPNGNSSVLCTNENLNDCHGNEVDKILSIEPLSFTNEHEVEDADGMLVGTKNNNLNDGLSLSLIKLIKKNESSEKQKTLVQIINPLTSQLGNIGLEINPTSIIISVSTPTNAPTVDTNFMSMYRDTNLRLMFVGLKVTNSGSNGAKAVFLATEIKNDTLATRPIVPDTALGTQDNIIATGDTGNHPIFIYHLKTILTSTYLKYLIVARGNDNNGARNVYAMPLVNAGSYKINEQFYTYDGSLANVNQIPETHFAKMAPYKFVGNQNLGLTRFFKLFASKPGDLYTTDSIPAKVGGQASLPGIINDLYAFKDAVFVSITPDAGKIGGIFHSQALFDSNGAIKCWSNWKHCVNTDIINFSPAGFAYDNIIACHYVISEDKKSIYRSGWSNGDSDLEKLISEELPKENYGVQAIKNFNAEYSDNKISILSASGLNKIILLQTGHLSFSDFIPQIKNYTDNVFKTTDGTFTSFDTNKQYSALSISGGALDQIRVVTSVEFIQKKWICIGGSGGLAILAKNSGCGYTNGLDNNFNNLTNDMKFILIENFKNIIKIASFNDYLFVLTNQNLYKIHITTDNIINNSLETVVLAQASDLGENASFSDMLLSNNLIVIAHSKGLMQNNLNNINVANAISDMGWKNIIIPEAAGSFNQGGPISRLFPISHTGNENDLWGTSAIGGTSITGNIIALNAYVSYNTAQVYRFNINSLGCLELFPDYYVKDLKTFFTNLGDYKNYFVTDGAACFTSRSANRGLPAFLITLDSSLRSGQPGTGKSDLSRIDNMGKLFAPAGCSSIRQLTKSACGDWMISGDFGLRLK